MGYTGIQSGAGTGNTLGYTHAGGNTLVEAADSTFAFTLTGEVELADGDFVFG